MQIQKIFRAGNSDVVAIPKGLLREKNLKTGQEIIVEAAPFGDVIVIRKKQSKKSKSDAAVSKEFKKWLRNVLEEDKEILDELELR